MTMTITKKRKPVTITGINIISSDSMYQAIQEILDNSSSDEEAQAEIFESCKLYPDAVNIKERRVNFRRW